VEAAVLQLKTTKINLVSELGALHLWSNFSK